MLTEKFAIERDDNLVVKLRMLLECFRYLRLWVH